MEHHLTNEEPPHEETCERHGQNMATKMCYGIEYMQRELERIAKAFERIAKVMEKDDDR